ncbi:hypothetical protein OEZ86_001864 [Tetradesmus obliquus]|nr:hypothetical protein OEZ86_001864 [Tetradesmus obliquus]
MLLPVQVWTEGSSVCTVCRTGQTNGAQGSSVCDWCAPGYKMVNVSNPAAGCNACGEGTVSLGGPFNATRSCQSCDRSRYTWRQERTYCNACRAGFGWINIINSNPNLVGICRDCPVGTWGPGGQAGNLTTTTCRACPPGYTTLGGQALTRDACFERRCAPGTAGLTCAACSPGLWSAGGNATTSFCRPCPVGTSSAAGAPSSAACNITVAVCSTAPTRTLFSLPDGPGYTVDATNWLTKCGKTLRGSRCRAQANELCPDGICSLSATCDATGKWIEPGIDGTTGAVCGSSPMPPKTAAGWFIFDGAPLDPTAWAAACSNKYQRQTCSTTAACGQGFKGNLSAVCQADGSWGQLSGECRSNTCAGAPPNVPVSGGATFITAAWTQICGVTPRGSNCTTSDACTPDGSVTATCSAAGTWINTSGGCSLNPTTPPCANTKGLEAVPWLDSAKWIAQCGNTAVGQTCSKTNTICAGGFVGTVSAVCFAAGWQVIQGQDRCGDTCSIAPLNPPVNPPGQFNSFAWNSICGNTPRGSRCSTTDACSPEGSVSATCGADGSWTNLAGGCFQSATDRCFTNNGMTLVPNLDLDTWRFECSATRFGQTCVVTTACKSGFLGTISALCTTTGWRVNAGQDACTDTCTIAPTNVPVTAPGSFNSAAWNSICGNTKVGSNCTTTDACTPDGFVSATCSTAGWVNIAGSCFKAAPPPPCATITGMKNVPWLDSDKWIAQCGNTALGQICSKTNTVCVGLDNFTVGTVSARCTSTGWTEVTGQCDFPATG